MIDEVIAEHHPVLSFCKSELCQGRALKDVTRANEDECSICLLEFDTKKVVRLENCNHFFCQDCVDEWQNSARRSCPMCRQKIIRTMGFSKAIVFESEYCKTLFSEHQLCPFLYLSDVYIAYLADLDDVWLGILNFINETRHIGIKGVEHLKLEKQKNAGWLLEEGERHIVLKPEGGKIQLLFSCCIPNMSMRLIIMPNSEEDLDIGANNDYADEIIDCITIQLRQCWKVFPRLISKSGSSEHIYVRKFKNVTCYFFASGYFDGSLTSLHYESMRDQLKKANRLNFDAEHYDRVRRMFPNINAEKMPTDPKYRDHGDCCYSIESDDEVSEGDEDNEDSWEDTNEGEQSSDESNDEQTNNEN